MKPFILKDFPLTIVTLLFVLFSAISAHAFSDKAFSVGIGYYSDNVLSKITQKETGAASLTGTPEYPLILKYDRSINQNYLMAAKLSWSLLGRKGVGDTVKSETLHLYFPIGKNISKTSWDWSIGPGILRQTLKGAGGITQMSNGTGTATFAVPGRSVTTQVITVNFGTSYTAGRSNFGIELVTEGSMSSTKRTFNLMLSYAYNFSGARNGKKGPNR